MEYGKSGKARKKGWRVNYDKDALKENRKHIRERKWEFECSYATWGQ